MRWIGNTEWRGLAIEKATEYLKSGEFHKIIVKRLVGGAIITIEDGKGCWISMMFGMGKTTTKDILHILAYAPLKTLQIRAKEIVRYWDKSFNNRGHLCTLFGKTFVVIDTEHATPTYVGRYLSTTVNKGILTFEPDKEEVIARILEEKLGGD